MKSIAFAASCLVATHTFSTGQPEPNIDTARVMRVAATKFAAFDKSQPQRDAFPTDAKGAAWRTVDASDWVSGFYPGALWYLYEYARDAKWPDADEWKARAEGWTASLESQQFNDHHHDTGFMIFNSYGNGLRITGNPAYKPVIIQTAKTLATRFRKETGMIRSWENKNDDKNFMVIIDNMMNLELLMWAAANGGPAELRETALSHADKTMEWFFRPDGGTYHVVDLDPLTGKLKRKWSAQGKAAESTWSRGQAWAIHGFTYMYGATKNPEYLKTALKAAEYFIDRMPADRVPPSDFDSTLTGLEFKDSSAAAIAVCAFLRLADMVDEPERKQRLTKVSTEILGALTTAPYFAEGDDRASLLVYSARNYHPDPAGPLTNTSLIWSDYYLLEALHLFEKSREKK